MKKLKRLCVKCTAWILLLLLLLSAVAACADAGEGDGTTAGVQESSTFATEETPTEEDPEESAPVVEDPTESVPIYSDTETQVPTQAPTQLPAQSEEETAPTPEPLPPPVDLGGYVYKAYSERESGSGAFFCEDFRVEADSTDPLSHAVYQRNAEIEVAYNCRIRQVEEVVDLALYYLNGETFELVIDKAMAVATYVTKGLLQDAAASTNLKLSEPAYDQNILRDLSIGGKVYMLSGDMNISSLDSAAVTICNTALFGNYDFGTLLGKPEYNDLYRLVEDGKWTVDALLAMASAVNDDADESGGTLDAPAGDTVGYFQYAASDQYYFWGSGARVSTNGEDGIPALTYASENAKGVVDFLFERLNVTVKNPAMPVGGSGIRANYWATGKTLFTDILLWDVRKIYHERDFSYAILPIPKMTETQTRYFDVVYYPYNTTYLWGLPVICENAWNATLLLDVIARSSTETTMQGYVLKTLQLEKVNDPMARKTLWTVRNSLTYDLSPLYDLGGFFTGTLARIDSMEKNAYADAVTEEALGAAEEEMRDTLKGFINPLPPVMNADGLVFQRYSDGTCTLIQCIDKSITKIDVPATYGGYTVTRIDPSALGGLKQLTAVTVPDSVLSIGSQAFSGCTMLESVTLPAGLTRISYRLFNGCTSLESVTLPAGVTAIDAEAFSGCTMLKSVTLPAGLTRISYRLFKGCTSLERITVPASVTVIGKEAFVGCTRLAGVTFEALNGWGFYAKDYDDVPVGLVPDKDPPALSDVAFAATSLKETYAKYTWKRDAEEN